MKLKSYLRRAAAWALCLLICAAGLCQSARAAGVVPAQAPITDFDSGPNHSLTIQYKAHWNSGVRFRVYQVASMDRNVKFTAVGSFKTYFESLRPRLDLNTLDETYEWDGLAETLKKVVLLQEASGNNALNPRVGELTTSTTGRQDAVVSSKGDYAELTFNGLYPGLYLVVGDSYQWRDPSDNQTYTYIPSTYLVCVPNWTYNSSTKQYEWTKNVVADARAKTAFSPNSTQGYGVAKNWNDNYDAAHRRPQSIQVALYQNGVIIDYVTLSEANKWRYYWSNLPIATYWVREIGVLPPGYTNTSNVDDAANKMTIITNTYNSGGGNNSSPTPQPVTTPPVSTPPPSSVIPPSSAPTPPIEIDDPDVPLGNVTPPPVTSTDPPDEIELDDPDVPLGDLPQTGQLWWPVPVLIVAGIVLLLVGVVRRRSGEFYDE